MLRPVRYTQGIRTGRTWNVRSVRVVHYVAAIAQIAVPIGLQLVGAVVRIALQIATVQIAVRILAVQVAVFKLRKLQGKVFGWQNSNLENQFSKYFHQTLSSNTLSVESFYLQAMNQKFCFKTL